MAPNLPIPRLDGGGDFQLASLNDAEKPTLLWFWAPWCPICNQEAPNVETIDRRAAELRADVIDRSAPKRQFA